MKSLSTLSAAALLAAGCASEPVIVAQKDCKVAPLTTASTVYTGKSKPVDSLRQREAQMDLATSQYRMAQLQRHGTFNNNVEEALRDCDMAK
jgi:hypothetical protein